MYNNMANNLIKYDIIIIIITFIFPFYKYCFIYYYKIGILNRLVHQSKMSVYLFVSFVNN